MLHVSQIKWPVPVPCPLHLQLLHHQMMMIVLPILSDVFWMYPTRAEVCI